MEMTKLVRAKDMVNKKPLELQEGIDMAVGAMFEKMAQVEQKINDLKLRVLKLEAEIKGGRKDE